MATLGVCNGYYDELTINPDWSVSYIFYGTYAGSQPSPQTEPADSISAYINFWKPFIESLTYPSFTFTPVHAIAFDIAVQKGIVAASQLKAWYAGADNMAVGDMYDLVNTYYYPDAVMPTPGQIAASPTTVGLKTSDSFTMSTVNTVTGQVFPNSGGTLPILTDHQETVTEMYLAAFLRAPEKGGLEYWAHLLDTGSSISNVGDIVFNLPVVKAIYGDSMTNDSFVGAIYHNVFGKTGDAEGLAFWTNKMNAGEHRGDLVMDMIGAGLGTPVGTPGRDYIVNRLHCSEYAVQKQIQNNVEIAVSNLIADSATVTADPTTVTEYHANIDAHIVTVVGVHP